MTYEEVFELGHFARLHGVKGELVLTIEADNPRHYAKTESIFVEQHKRLIPFFVSAMRFISADSAVVRLEDVDSPEEADKLSGCSVFLPLDKLPKLKGNQYYFHELIGCQVQDEAYGQAGIVTQIYETPQQILMGFELQGKEVLMPLNDDFFVRLDRENKTVFTKMPEGLIDLYLEASGAEESKPSTDDAD